MSVFKAGVFKASVFKVAGITPVILPSGGNGSSGDYSEYEKTQFTISNNNFILLINT